MPTITVLNDIHLKPAYESVVDDFRLPRGTDGVVIAGDLLDKPERDHCEQARQLLARLDAHDVPTVYVPGNHDPLATARIVAEGFDSVELAHDRSVTGAAFDGQTVFDDVAVVGWGCTQFDAGCEIEYESASEFAIRDEHGHVDRYRESQASQQLLGAVDALIDGARDVSEVRDALGLPAVADEDLTRIREVGTRLRDHIITPERTLVATHVPPFGTDLDRHHSAENRPMDGLHEGSLAIAGAIRATSPAFAVSGHSHVRGYGTYDAPPPHLLNGGFRGITTVELEGDRVGFEFHTPDWLPGE
ncbi:metallophosphoesterase family protein [Halobaculum rubrum]|uniref:metallophosphoesterase family protein n=1 Tax=Halobaculum rubrum TaxID=2872158 RepID=UPI001CA46C08|nr:metallophosphoesterase [Halobaculum rubrum]QZY01168.1 metallophosphoesterase [Halobaculum rubrum]